VLHLRRAIAPPRRLTCGPSTLCGSYENYQRKFQAAKATAIAQGYLLPEDSKQLEPVARPEDFRGSD
jgi:hypothetical protein